MRHLAPVALLFAALPAVAHDGHGATPAHAHVAFAAWRDFPVDVGGVAFVAAACVLLARLLWLARQPRR